LNAIIYTHLNYKYIRYLQNLKFSIHCAYYVKRVHTRIEAVAMLKSHDFWKVGHVRAILGN